MVCLETDVVPVAIRRHQNMLCLTNLVERPMWETLQDTPQVDHES